MTQFGSQRSSVKLVSIGYILTTFVLLGLAGSLTVAEYDGVHAICTNRCNVYVGDPPTHQVCLLECRNYIESTLSRARTTINSKFASPAAVKMSTSPLTMSRRMTRTPGGEFVRIGRAANEEEMSAVAEKRNMRGSFVRIGRQSDVDGDNGPDGESTLNTDVTDETDDVTKRKSGFVRIGRRKATEEFVRIGKQSPSGGDKPEAELDGGNNNDDDGAEEYPDLEKKAARGAFVRIGRRNPSNFVRIGRKATAFVRIGKKSDDSFDDGGVPVPMEGSLIG